MTVSPQTQHDIHTPEWVHHAVFYQIFPDRFAKSDSAGKPSGIEPWDSPPTDYGYKGGDLVGVMERLDYLQDLGVTALYFNPIFQSASNHRYHTHDFYQVDPLLGGNDAFDALLDECHRRGMRLVLDGVFNHASRGFFQFNDILENGASSPWLDWFTVHEHPANAYDHARPAGYRAWVDLHALPSFNTDNPQVREYIMRIGEYWIEKGIDGWRLDVPFEILTPGFWAEFRDRVRAINPDAYLVGEIWGDASEWLQGDQFDATMNYLFTEAAIAFAGRHRIIPETVAGRSYAPHPGISGTEYARKIDRVLGLYAWPIQLAQLNLLDSHDTSRMLSVVGGDQRSVELAALLMFTFPGAPSIYYGDEIGIDGALPTDKNARKTFPWNQPETWNRDLFNMYRDLIHLRKDYPALRTGDYHAVGHNDDIYAFVRTLNGDKVLTALNTGDTASDLTLDATGPLSSVAGLEVAFSISDAASATVDGNIRLSLPPRSGTVMRVITS